MDTYSEIVDANIALHRALWLRAVHDVRAYGRRLLGRRRPRRRARPYLGLSAAPAAARPRLCDGFAAEKIAPFFEDWNDHEAHADNTTNFFHILVYEYQATVGVLLIPVICWLFPFQGLWPTQWPIWGQVLMAFIFSDFAFMAMH